jgi:hypothetical protein
MRNGIAGLLQRVADLLGENFIVLDQQYAHY